MITVEELTGHDLRALKEKLGRPFTVALEESDPDAIYAFVWIAEKRDNAALKFGEVLARPFGEVMEAFTDANEPDPTPAGDGNA